MKSLLSSLQGNAVPNFSNAVNIAKLRYIQALHGDNPDILTGYFLSPALRWISRLQGKIQLEKLRKHPFYHYLIARTKHYDKIFTDAVEQGIKYIFIIGSGCDTRAYRFASMLQRWEVTVFECDLAKLITVKQNLAKRWSTAHVNYIALDITDKTTWQGLEYWFEHIPSATLVIMEGVSPYIAYRQFGCFLAFLASKLPAGSRIAYDYKINDRKPNDKRSFALPITDVDVLIYHGVLGLRLEDITLSSEFCGFAEDSLITLSVE